MNESAWLPRSIYFTAMVGTIFVVLPLEAVAVKLACPRVRSLIAKTSSRTAPLLSADLAAENGAGRFQPNWTPAMDAVGQPITPRPIRG